MYPDPTSDGLPTALVVFLVLFALFFLTAVVFIVTGAVRSRRVLKDAGLDPLAAEAQLAVRFAQSGMLSPSAPAQSLEQRLAELTDLHARGVISDVELAAARAKALEQ